MQRDSIEVPYQYFLTGAQLASREEHPVQRLEAVGASLIHYQGPSSTGVFGGFLSSSFSSPPASPSLTDSLFSTPVPTVMMLVLALAHVVQPLADPSGPPFLHRIQVESQSLSSSLPSQ
eukprot:g13028.t1